MPRRQPKRAVRIQSLLRASSILDVVAKTPGGAATLAEISRKARLNKTTAFNLAGSLVSLGFLERDGSRKYQLGLRNLELGSLVRQRLDLDKIGRPALQHICTETGETANLAVPHAAAALIIDSLEGRHGLRSTTYAGARSDYHSSACGKAILAFLSKPVRDAIYQAQPFTAHTPHTITDPLTLERQLDLVRSDGYATEAEENEVGQACIAAPIFDGFGEIAGAISVAGPVGRITQGRKAILETLMQHTRALTKALGGHLERQQ